ncbi:ATPase [Dehalococcoides mccartyi]|uniref:PAS domain-containing sensor histidine kinase n=1 Tax=Dehalococcoides mccartyi TaxID=61435 RepID=UPI0002B760F2|nr:PAS domain-containing sensor histidine kinase [Dehalococcoides mccartyi]AGG08487.1 PAS domain signal transduction histidine kinase [Dehalococcoides mccartyi BTF08]KSV17328.1 ATPase [Dehalococcoides mccartyi]
MIDSNNLYNESILLHLEQCQIQKMVFELSNDAICIDLVKGPGKHDRIFAEVNPAFEKFSGYKRSELIGKDTSILFPGKLESIGTDINHKLWQKKNLVMDITTQSKTGKNIQVELSAHMFKVNGKWICIIIGRDISDRKRAEMLQSELFKKEQDLRKKLEQAEKERLEFLRALVHELKTPLTPMLAMTEMLAYESKGILKQYANNLNTSTIFLLSRINDLYDLARSEVKMLTINKSWVNIDELLADIKSLEENSCKTKSMQLRIHISQPNIRCFIDGERIKQVIINLLNNAIKYNPPGCSIDIEAQIKEPNLIINVTDNGVGIPVEDQNKLFLPHQIKKSSGLGLGLSLSAKLVELHGGSIAVKSKLNEGSQFTVCLPKCNNIL